MPRKSLRAAAMTLLMAAWSMQPAQADDGKPSAFKFANPFARKAAEQSTDEFEAEEKAEKPARRTPKIAPSFDRLKQAVGIREKSPKIEQASHAKPGAEVKVAAKPKLAPSTVKARTAAYNDDQDEMGDEFAPPAVALPAPPALAQAAPPPGPLPAVPAGPTNLHPAMTPLPVQGPDVGRAVVPGYPYLNAPLNPCPIPNVPYQVGSTIITNQALYPHELQYPHEYRAMYPPYYYKVKGHWMVTPWGVWSNDRWELQGTEVKIKYRSNYSFFSGFTPPHTGR